MCTVVVRLSEGGSDWIGVSIGTWLEEGEEVDVGGYCCGWLEGDFGCLACGVGWFEGQGLEEDCVRRVEGDMGWMEGDLQGWFKCKVAWVEGDFSWSEDEEDVDGIKGNGVSWLGCLMSDVCVEFADVLWISWGVSEGRVDVDVCGSGSGFVSEVDVDVAKI